jgi:hypothetical protein
MRCHSALRNDMTRRQAARRADGVRRQFDHAPKASTRTIDLNSSPLSERCILRDMGKGSASGIVGSVRSSRRQDSEGAHH